MARGSDSLWARHRQPVSWSEEGDGHPPHHVARQRWSARVTSRSPRGVGVLGERGLGRFGVLDAHASGCVCGTCTGAPTAGDGEQTSGAWPLLADPPGWDKIQQGKGQVTRETVAGGGMLRELHRYQTAVQVRCAERPKGGKEELPLSRSRFSHYFRVIHLSCPS